MILYKQKPITKDELTEIHQNEARLAGSFLQVARDGKSFVCPVCGRGGADSSHKDGLHIGKDGRLLECFSCHAGGDVIKIYQDTYKVGFAEAVRTLQAGGFSQQVAIPAQKPKPRPKIDFLTYFQKCMARIEKTTYHRGISLDTLKRYWIGFDSEWRSPTVIARYNGWQPPATPRLIIPTSRYSYLARRTDGLKDYEKMYEGEPQPFNLKALKDGGTIFVVEGEIDALSFIDVGAMAIGLGGSRGGGKLIEALKHCQFNGRLFLVGDTDGKQDNQYPALCDQAQALGVKCEYVQGIKLFGIAKDGNEALTENRQNFKDRIGVFIDG
jgi:replicative DNA helicase